MCEVIEMGIESLPRRPRDKTKATKKQDVIAGLAIAGILIVGVFALVFGVIWIIDIPEEMYDQEDALYGIVVLIGSVALYAGAFGLIRIFSKVWHVKFSGT